MKLNYPMSGWDLGSFKALVDRDAPHYSWIFNHYIKVVFIEPFSDKRIPFYNTKIGLEVAKGRSVQFLYHRLSLEEHFGDETTLELVGQQVSIETIIREFGRVHGLQLTDMDIEFSKEAYPLTEEITQFRVRVLPTSLVWRDSCLINITHAAKPYLITEVGDSLETEGGDIALFEGD